MPSRAIDGAAGAPRRRRSVSGAPWAYRAPAGRVRYRSRSRAISAMWWMNSRLDAQITEMNGSSGAELRGYWSKPTVSSCSGVTAATLSRQRSIVAQNRSSAAAAADRPGAGRRLPQVLLVGERPVALPRGRRRPLREARRRSQPVQACLGDLAGTVELVEQHAETVGPIVGPIVFHVGSLTVAEPAHTRNHAAAAPGGERHAGACWLCGLGRWVVRRR